METFFWYDYETFGRNPGWDRPAQFAGIRTDKNLNVIGKPVVAYCKLSNDTLPQPEAVLVTGLTPQDINNKGVSEAEFAKIIYKEFSVPNTCIIGYNNIRFDDEFTRNIFYRNFYDPFDYLNVEGNSRWDLIDVVRVIRLLRPDGINWPKKEDGTFSTKLEDLTIANGIEHDAHDALADVRATIKIAKLLKTKQLKLFHYVFENRSKEAVAKLLGLVRGKLSNISPLLHISSKYSGANNCFAIVIPVGRDFQRKNNIIVANLLEDPTPLVDNPSWVLRDRLFLTKDELEDGVQKTPLQSISLTKCPVLISTEHLRKKDFERLNINYDRCLENLRIIKKIDALSTVAGHVYRGSFFEREDPELQIYDGFLSNEERVLVEDVRDLLPEEFNVIKFKDSRMSELLFRYKARNFLESLTKEEQLRWEALRKKRLTESIKLSKKDDSLTLESYYNEIDAKLKEDISERDKLLLLRLKDYGKEVEKSLEKTRN